MAVYRVYVEKKPEFAVKAGHLKEDIQQALNITIDKVRIINRYDIEGTTQEKFLASIPHIFSEPPVDKIYTKLPRTKGFLLAVEYLPGQFDQRGDSAAQCFQLFHQGEKPIVKTATIYLFSGQLTDEDQISLTNYLINPIEAREASLTLPKTLKENYSVIETVPKLTNFLKLDEEGLVNFLDSYSLAMDLEDLKICQKYFKEEGRIPNLAEIRILDTYWSDHCRHTTFSTNLIKVEIEDELVEKSYRKYLKLRDKLYGDKIKPKTLMDLGTIGAKYLKNIGKMTDLDESEEINACSVNVKIDIDGKPTDYLFMFKNETHNHPTEVEPYGGAATCLGGAIRDPLSGRSYVYQAMRVTGSGDPYSPTLQGKLPQRKITTGAASGFSSYGNQIGLATGLVDEIYHPGYVAKRMEVGAVLGATPKANVKRETPASGDIVILIGGRTGRDGCGGATGSSKSHSQDSLATCSAEVQKGNPTEERKLQRLFRNPEFTRLIKRCNDFGAGGVSVAVGELAPSLSINLDAIPKKYIGLDGIELAISESQERMAVVIQKHNLPHLLKLAEEENVEATEIAQVTDDGYLRMYWQGKELVSLRRDFLDTNGAQRSMEVKIPKYEEEVPRKNNWFEQLADLNICSKKGLGEQFDSTIGAGTVLMPFGGKEQLTPIQAMVARFPVLEGTTDTCSVFAYSFDPYTSSANPYLGAYTSVIHSIAKIVAAGGTIKKCWLSFQEYFPKLGNDPVRWGLPMSSLLGAFEAQIALGIGAIGGKDSMSGSYEELDVPPTLISFAASVGDYKNIVSPEFKEAGNKVIYITPERNDDGIFNEESLKTTFEYIEDIRDRGVAKAIYAIGKGGISEAIAKMSFGNRIGFNFLQEMCQEQLFASDYGSFLIEVNNGCHGIADTIGEVIGETIAEYEIRVNDVILSLDEIEAVWTSKLNPIFPVNHKPAEKMLLLNNYKTKNIFKTNTPNPRPKALVPVFPGTNCEYDTTRALNRAGAEAEIFVLRNLSPSSLEESIIQLEKKILESQMVVLPGGFSGGDEPDGSAKLIAAFFRNPRLEAAVMELLYRKDGLICGICNGFQALLKLGLVPYGKILEQDDQSPTLAMNMSGRHQSSLVRTKVISNNSPWLSDFKPGEIFTVAVSHGEGRFTTTDTLINNMNDNGQIATVYVDGTGNQTGEFPFNPNGSHSGIEGILSPDGRIYGRMAHSERFLTEVYKNVPGEKRMDIFKSGVKYFL
jgi:phosphoribosylformylglycinamidine synthase